MTHPILVGTATVLLCLTSAFVPVAADPVPGRNLVPKGSSEAGLRMSISALSEGASKSRRVDDYGSVAVGDTVRVCFSSGKAGFITLWVHASTGDVWRILPNDFTQDVAKGDTIPVAAGIEYCVAGDGLRAGDEAVAGNAGWGFKVEPPPGRAELYLHWTPDYTGGLPEASFVDIDALSTRVSRNNRSGANHADAWFTFTVTKR